MLLVEQYYENPKFGKFLEENFVLYRAPRGDAVGDEIFKKFNVQGTPFILFLDKDGREVDWIRGYAPPPEKLHARFLNIIKGVDTFKSLTAAYDADPRNAGAVVKLGSIIEERYGRDKAVENAIRLSGTNGPALYARRLAQIKEVLTKKDAKK